LELFENEKIELPNVCNPAIFPDKDFIKWESLTSIASGGEYMLKCWG